MLLLCLSACASSPPPSPYFGDERWLVVGVAPSREADALIAQMKAHGRTLALRLHGVHHTALAFADSGGAIVAVRVVTAHGIALALDAEAAHALRPGRAWRLLRSPLSASGGGPNADEYVFVQERVGGNPACVRIYRVRPDGEVRPEPRAVDPEGRVACAEDAADAPDAADTPDAPDVVDATGAPTAASPSSE